MGSSASPPKTVRFRFKNPRYDRLVRLNTESIARTMGFDEDRIFDLSLAVEEAYANALEHSRLSFGESDLELEILYQIYPDRIEVRIQDSGCGFREAECDCSKKPAEHIPDRGRGLELIRCLSDQTEILSSPGLGTLIRITKFLATPASPHARELGEGVSESPHPSKKKRKKC